VSAPDRALRRLLDRVGVGACVAFPVLCLLAAVWLAAQGH
jgi:hypothetical protein